MASSGMPPGGNPIRLPGFTLGAAVSCCKACGCSKCECDTHAPPLSQSADIPSAYPSETGSYSIDNTTAALDQTAAILQTAAQVGVPLPTFQLSPGACGHKDGGPCGLWMNLEGNLVAQVSAPSAGPLSPRIVLTYNSVVTQPGPYGSGWSLNLSSAVVTNGSDVILSDSIGTTYPYEAPPVTGTSFTYVPPDGARNSLAKTATGWELRQPDGFKQIFNSAGRLIS